MTGFDWKSLPKDSLVVDVAGGIGTQSAALAKEYDHLRFVVQDQAAVLTEHAEKVTISTWRSSSWDLQAHLFTSPFSLVLGV